MNKNILKEHQMEINMIEKEISDFYGRISNGSVFSDSALWILYFLRLTGKPLTQSEICTMMFQSKQTVNSTLKKLCDEGYIIFKSSEKDKKRKPIYLTEKGERLCADSADKVISAETAALENFSEEELAAFISLHKKYFDNLKESFSLIYGELK